MVDYKSVVETLPKAFLGLGDEIPGKRSGKVRDWYSMPGQTRLMVTTDRISAFDRVLGAVPWKGQVLNQLSAFWNEATRDIVANHLISLPDPNVAIVRETKPLPVEVIVRGYITGVTSTSLWRRYSEGDRNIYGYDFPEGLEKNRPLPAPIITPTTKAEAGMHDERLTCAEVVSGGFVDPSTWKKVMEIALALFDRGTRLSEKSGVILVDTKYEFGLDDAGGIVLIDEIHTPDSSRFWKLDSYESRLAAGREPEIFDKEFVRMKYVESGYRGEGEIPDLPESVWAEASQLYQAAYEMVTGKRFEAGSYPVGKRILENLDSAGVKI
jgi:phosphoribosylaminoimidazole-succinocarboxamide synthase